MLPTTTQHQWLIGVHLTSADLGPKDFYSYRHPWSRNERRTWGPDTCLYCTIADSGQCQHPNNPQHLLLQNASAYGMGCGDRRIHWKDEDALM